MKSGTTALAEYLMGHPQAYMTPEKELYFFESDEYWARGPEWYAAHFAAVRDELVVGEASPSYMCHPSAAERMASLLPDAKLIAILRDPVDRAYSHYWNWRARRGYESRTFAEAVRYELDLPDPWVSGYWGPFEVPGFYYLARGRYLAQLERLLERYPRESLLVLLNEDLEARPQETFGAVCRFLGIDDTYVPENVGERTNPHFYIRNPRLWRLLIRVRASRWMPERVLVALYWRLRSDEPYPPMDQEVRSMLVEHYRADNDRLAEWLGRDLSHWNAAERP